jgi:hypothetical protein
MTKKHFIAMASEFKIILKNAEGEKARAAVIECIESFMFIAAGTNGRFDHDRFSTACGM